MRRIWLKEYAPLVPETIDPDAVNSVVDVFAESVVRFSDSPAFTNRGTTLSYRDVNALSRNLAAYLRGVVGIQKGDRVAIMLPNVLQYPVALFGILRVGGIVVNVNPLYSERELAHQLMDAEPTAIIAISSSTPTLSKAIDTVPVEHIIVAHYDDLLAESLPAGEIAEGVGDYVEFKHVLDRGRQLESGGVSITGSDVALLQYTGGTTGLSKGAMLTHRNLIANILQFAAWYADDITEGEDIFFTALPLYHIFALTANCFCPVNIGALSVLITDPRDLPAVRDTFKEYRYTFVTGVNTLYNGMLHTEGFADLDFSLKVCIGGGAAVQRVVAEKWQAVTGCLLSQGYGLTETSPILTISPSTAARFDDSIGLPVPSTDIVLLDDDGNEVTVGEPGELCARGPQVMKGYWKQEKATREVMTADGFFRTGDIATVDEKGYFRIVDRKKEMILVSGFNVFPNEIESVVAECAGVRECACIGIPDQRTGEAVKVYVVRLGDVDLNEDDVVAFCKDKLTGYKVPKRVEFIDELPKSNVGKILRRELRKIATS